MGDKCIKCKIFWIFMFLHVSCGFAGAGIFLTSLRFFVKENCFRSQRAPLLDTKHKNSKMSKISL